LREAIRINPLSVENHYVLGKFTLDQGNPAQALPEFERAVAIRPRFVSGEEGIATADEALGNNRDALAHWRKAHAIDPTRISSTLGIAWLLATAPEASLRNGNEALSLAEAANNLATSNDPTVLDTLAAAYAENGQFAQAVALETRALELATESKNTAMAKDIRSRLTLYKAKRPFRSERSAAPPQAMPVTATRQPVSP
jgi:tetratricopeptide (TPR) repeat protein